MNILASSLASSLAYTPVGAIGLKAAVAPQATTGSPVDTVTISQSAKNLLAATQASSTSTDIEAFDFTNMTPQQMQNTINGLIKSGKMSLDESAPLVGMIPTALSAVNDNGQTPAAFRQPMNFIAGLEDSITGALSRNDTATAAFFKTALTALQRLQNA